MMSRVRTFVSWSDGAERISTPAKGQARGTALADQLTKVRQTWDNS